MLHRLFTHIIHCQSSLWSITVAQFINVVEGTCCRSWDHKDSSPTFFAPRRRERATFLARSDRRTHVIADPIALVRSHRYVRVFYDG